MLLPALVKPVIRLHECIGESESLVYTHINTHLQCDQSLIYVLRITTNPMLHHTACDQTEQSEKEI